MWRFFWVGALVLLVVGAVTASAAMLSVTGGTLQSWTFTVTIPTPTTLSATVDLKPESLQRKSEGQPITGYIELPPGYDVRNIVISMVKLCHGGACVPANPFPTAIGDYDGDGIRDLMVKFDRAAVLALVADVRPPAPVTFVVSGTVTPPGRAFSGSDTVTLVDPEHEATPTPTRTASPGPTASPTRTATPTATRTPTLTATPTPARTATPTPSPTPTRAKGGRQG